MIILRFLIKAAGAALTALMLFTLTILPSVKALTPAQQLIYREGINYFDINSCSTDESASTDVATGSGAPTGLVFPNLDPTSMAKSIDAFIKKENANSNLNGLGETIVASSKESNVNPFLVVSIAHKESSLADPTDFNTAHGNNPFGRKATSSQPHFQGSATWYKWSSVKASVDSSADENKAKNSGGDETTFLRDAYGSILDQNDLRALISKYGDDVDEYVTNVTGWMKEMATAADKLGSSASVAGSSVYMVGDSVTVRARDDLKKAFQAKDISAYINASVSRSITQPGVDPGYKTSGLQAVEGDAERIKKVDSVVIALGTNQRDSNFETSIKNMVKKIKAINSGAQIYWVDVFSEGGVDKEKVNRSISSLSGSEDYKVIDTTGDDIPLDTDHIHETFGNGTRAFAKIVVDDFTSNKTNGSTDTSTDSDQCKCSDSSTPLTGSGDEDKIYNYLTGKGLTPLQTAAIMGNFAHESGFNPRSYYPSTTTDNPDPSRAFGIAQWLGNRQTNLRDRAQKAGKPITDLGVQLDYLWEELTGGYRSTVLEPLKAATDLRTAVQIWNDHFEINGVDPNQRVPAARDVLTKYGSSGASGTSTDPGSGATSCQTSTSGDGKVVGEYSLPVEQKWYDQHPEWFTKPHHDYPAADIPVPSGTKVFAAAKGTVSQTVQSGPGGGAGTHVFITDGTVVYGYFHGTPGSIKVNVGDMIKPGQLLMLSDNTGHTTGAHLHFQIEIGSVKHCPQNFLNAIGKGKAPPALDSLPTSGCTD